MAIVPKGARKRASKKSAAKAAPKTEAEVTEVAEVEVKATKKTSAASIPVPMFQAAPEAVARVVRRFAAERNAAETFQDWLARSGGAVGVADGLRDLDDIPLPDVAPDFFVDYDETGPFSGEVGDSECAV